MRKNTVKWAAYLLALTFILMVIGPTAAFARADGEADKSRNVASETTVVSSAFTPSQLYPFSVLKKAIEDRAVINKDVVGYLIIPGTNINMPILAAPNGGQKNEYYEKRDWRGNLYPNNNYQNYQNTATYLDYRVKLGESWRNATSQNVVIYGHNWTNLRTPYAIGGENNHIMFAQLPSYTDINFARQNPYIYFSTGQMEGVWKVFSVAYCEVKTSFLYNAPNPQNHAALLAEWKQRSMFNFGVDVAETDRILTLSTCIRQYPNMGAEQRFVVVARLLRYGESEQDAVTVSVNPNQKPPQF